MSERSEVWGWKWDHPVFQESMLQVLSVLQHLRVLCKYTANVQIHTKALVRPPANTHAEAGKHRCSAGWQAEERGKDSYSLLLDPIENINSRRRKKNMIRCFQFYASSVQHTSSSKHTVIIWEFSLWAVGSFIPHCKLWSYTPSPFCTSTDLLSKWCIFSPTPSDMEPSWEHFPGIETDTVINITHFNYMNGTCMHCRLWLPHHSENETLAGLCKVQEQNRTGE